MKYKVGDKVRITKDLKKCARRNPEGLMDRWQGKIMTVKSVDCDSYKMEEDMGEYYGSWFWYEDMISGLAKEFITQTEFTVDKTRGFKSIYINGITIAIPIETPVGIARKNPADEYDEELGKSLAYYRMEGVE